MDGKMCAGKLSPANPHLTNPVPLSHTTGGLAMVSSVHGAAAKLRAGPRSEHCSPRPGVWEGWGQIPTLRIYQQFTKYATVHAAP